MTVRQPFVEHLSKMEPDRPPDFDAMARAHAAAQAEASWRQQQAEAARERDEQDRTQESAMRQAEANALERMKALAPLYAQRAEMAKSLLSQLAELYALNDKLIAAEHSAQDLVKGAWNARISRPYHAERWQDLRGQAGLRPNHEQLGLVINSPAELAAAIPLKLIASGALQPGTLDLGTTRSSFDFTRGL